MISVLRLMSAADVPAGLSLCRAAGWNQVARDWEMYLRTSPFGCLVAESSGRTVGTVTTVRYQDRFAWIGMVLVDPAFRGQGIGTQLLRGALDLVQDIPSVKLDATPAGRPVYVKLGFEEEYSLVRMEARIDDVPLRTSSSAVPIATAQLPEILRLDREVFGADREQLLQWMLEGAGEYAWAVPGKGYLFGRHGHDYEHLGPLIAEDEMSARSVLEPCLPKLLGRKVILDVPLGRQSWQEWLRSLGFREQRSLVRMFLRSNRFPGQPSKQFAILGPEWG